MERIELCANKCCPTLAKFGDSWIVNDDHGGEVRLTSDQLDNLVKIKSKYENDLLNKRIAESEKATKDGVYI